MANDCLWKPGDLLLTPGKRPIVCICKPYKHLSVWTRHSFIQYYNLDESKRPGRATVIQVDHCSYVRAMTNEELLTHDASDVRKIALRRIRAAERRKRAKI